MKKRIALLLAGTLTLSMLLSACGSQAETETPSADVEETASASVSVETGGAAVTRAAPDPTEPVQAEEPPAQVSAEPSEPVESADVPAVASAPTQAAAEPTQAPAVVSTPKPSVSTPATPAPAVNTPAPVAEPPATAAPQPTPEPVPEPVATPAPPAPAATKEAAMAYIGRSVSSLIAAIGQPNGRDYAPSCMGDGEDGELFYNGFTVYTYREGNTETVQDVI